MISVMLAISHVVMLSRIAHSSINTLHKIDLHFTCKSYRTWLSWNGCLG